MNKMTAEGCLVMQEAMFSSSILLYFLQKVDWDFYLKAAAFIGLQFPIFILWGIIHIVAKEVFKKWESR